MGIVASAEKRKRSDQRVLLQKIYAETQNSPKLGAEDTVGVLALVAIKISHLKLTI
jgi:hypothetical protein